MNEWRKIYYGKRHLLLIDFLLFGFKNCKDRIIFNGHYIPLDIKRTFCDNATVIMTKLCFISFCEKYIRKPIVLIQCKFFKKKKILNFEI